eukprot:scaffold5143_cov119-Isochrysis_galbana.AAC.2
MQSRSHTAYGNALVSTSVTRLRSSFRVRVWVSPCPACLCACAPRPPGQPLGRRPNIKHRALARGSRSEMRAALLFADACTALYTETREAVECL